MKHNKLVLPIVAVLILAIVTLAVVVQVDWVAKWIFSDTSTKIQMGFSSELLNTLSEKYQITIPEDARFLNGINTNAFRDPSVVILFECPAEDYTPTEGDVGYSYVMQKLKLSDSRYQFCGDDEKIMTDWYDEIGGLLDYRIADTNDPHTFISYSFEKNILTIRFVGRHPGALFS